MQNVVHLETVDTVCDPLLISTISINAEVTYEDTRFRRLTVLLEERRAAVKTLIRLGEKPLNDKCDLPRTR